MTYIVLLRGINVGGNNKVSMSRLKEVLEELGCEDVKTYINSGNAVLRDVRSTKALNRAIEDSLKQAFGFEIKALTIKKPIFDQIAAALLHDWRNDDKMRCNVLFLWDDVNAASILDNLPVKADIDKVKYIDGAIIWITSREDAAKSGLLKLVGTDLYKKMTIRNCNTVRKLADLAA